MNFRHFIRALLRTVLGVMASAGVTMAVGQVPPAPSTVVPKQAQASELAQYPPQPGAEAAGVGDSALRLRWLYSRFDVAKLQDARRYVQAILDEDRAPREIFAGRHPQFPGTCGTHVVARAMQVQEPWFEDVPRLIAVVPVWAEILMVEATSDGGTLSTIDGRHGSMCAFEYEQWNFATRQFERIDGFRTRHHFDEFNRWGEVQPISQTHAWIAIDRTKRYVRFFARVAVGPEVRLLAPHFPVHYEATHALKLLGYFNDLKRKRLELGQSDRGINRTPVELAQDLQRMRRQLFHDSWAAERLHSSLQELLNIRPFEEVAK